MIPIFIKVHANNGLMRVNVNNIERYFKRTPSFENPDYATTLVVSGFAMWVHETPTQIDNLIKKATLARFEEMDEVV